MRNNALDIWRGGNVWNMDPLRRISALQRGIDRMFDDMLSPLMTPDFDTADHELMRFQPTVDVEEKDNHYLMAFDLPGVSKNDVKVELQDNQLIVSGERKEEREQGRGARQVRERTYGTFQRVFTLPSTVDVNRIEANYENGVLTLAVPKAEAARTRQIQIGEKKGGILGKLLGKAGEKTQEKPEKAA